MVIYADVLFVLNFFITYLLLLLTRLLSKRDAKVVRLLFGALVGGAYSLVIFVDNLNFMISFAGKLIVSVLIVLTAFGFKNIRAFFKSLLFFYLSNMFVLGAITAFWMLAKPKGLALNNNIVYFDIPAKILLLCAAAAYIIAVVIVKIYNRTVGKNEIYSVTVIKNDEKIHLFAFADTGNKLREPFSGYPVIVADSSKMNFDCERIIPFNTVADEGVLNSFRPDKIIISNGKNSIETDKVYIALSRVSANDYSAVINPELLNF